MTEITQDPAVFTQVELIVGLCMFLLAVLYWIYKAAKLYNHLDAHLAPLNPTLMDADSNLTWALCSFLAGALLLIIVSLGGTTNG